MDSYAPALERVRADFQAVREADPQRIGPALAKYGAALAGFAAWAGEQERVGFSDIVSIHSEKIRELAASGEAPAPAVLARLDDWQAGFWENWRHPRASDPESWLYLLAAPELPQPLGPDDIEMLGQMLALDAETVPAAESIALPASAIPAESRDGPPAAPPDDPDTAAPLEIGADGLRVLREEWRELGPFFAAQAAALAASPAERPEIAARLDSLLEPYARGCAALGLTAGERMVRALLANLDADSVPVDLLLAWTEHFGTWLERLPEPDAAANLLATLVDPRWPRPLPEPDADALRGELARLRVAQRKTAPVQAAPPTPEDVALDISPDIDRGLLDTLLAGLPRQTAEFSATLQRLLDGGDLEDLRAARRIAHTLKGSGNLAGIRGIAQLTHDLEDILETLFERQTPPTPALGRLLQEAGDCLEAMSDALVGKAPAPGEALAVLGKIRDGSARLASGEDWPVTEDGADPSSTQPPGPPPAAASGETAPEEILRVAAERVHELFRQTGESLILGGQVKERLGRATTLAKTQRQLGRQLESLLAEQETLVDIRGISFPTLAGRAVPAAGSEGFDPLEMEQYHELHTLTHRLLEAATDIRDLNAALLAQLQEIEGALARQDRLHRETQATLLDTRLVAAESIFARCSRCVRQTSRLTGKPAELTATGGDTLVDGALLERLADALMHLLRNAVDHGIEPPERRRALGKDAVGRIRLAFARHGHRVQVRIEDDGGGLDPERIRRAAVAKGLLGADRVLSEDEAIALVLLPGFSTREAATQVSGRGVGLDAVRDAILDLKGDMDIRSRPDQGCTIDISLPITLVSSHVLVVEGRQRYAIAHAGLERILYPGAGTLEADGERLHYAVDGGRHPAVHLETLLGLAVATDGGTLPAVLVAARPGDLRAVLLPRTVLGTREVVVKSLGDYLPNLSGVAGAALLGDGGVVPVLDLPELLRAAQPRRAAAIASGPTAQPAEPARLPRALVVDDSLSARRALAQFLGDAGYRVETAIDGQDALDRLPGFRPDLVVTDLEMPRLNGVELAARLRSGADTRHLPIAMITSRSTDKHRREAERAGVNLYFTKPYIEEDLLRGLRGLLDGGA